MDSVGHVARIVLVAKRGDRHTGVGRYEQALRSELHRAGVNALEITPANPPVSGTVYSTLGRLGLDPRAFLATYPVWARYPRADVYHLTSQNLASLLVFHPPRGKVVVTVHDIIPYLLRHQPRLRPHRTVADRIFDHLAMVGLKRAHLLIAVSEDTRQCLVERLGIPAARIEVVWQGIDHARFQPESPLVGVRERYRLPAGPRYLIYVGSEDPRKDLTTLMRALALVRADMPDVELVKVGRAHFDRERQRLVEIAGQLEIRDAVHFLDDVVEDDLPSLYGLADVAVMPSLYEGFGLPALEAMACGRPLVYARAGSLPEIAGEAGIPVTPGSPEALARTLVALLGDPERRRALGRAGRDRAASFTWERTARGTISAYARVSGQAHPSVDPNHADQTFSRPRDAR